MLTDDKYKNARVRHIFITVILSVCLFLLNTSAYSDDIIKVLMLDSPNNPLPSAGAQQVEHLEGRILFNGQTHSGSFEFIKDETGLHVINNIAFEKYIEGVVASELGKNWEMEALKSQAVIARTYALFYKNINGDKQYHLTSSVLHQSYKGDNIDPLIALAVEATKGEILVYEGSLIKALYHATCEGKTELPEEVWAEGYPYLRSVDCNGKDAPYESWKKRFSLDDIKKVLGNSELKDISIASYTSTGRAKLLKMISAADTETEIKATELRRLLGYKELPSTNFSITKSGSEFVFEGKGYGHGVGLSQWGALAMAQDGKDYREILMHYYPGTTITMNNMDLHSHNLTSEK